MIGQQTLAGGNDFGQQGIGRKFSGGGITHGHEKAGLCAGQPVGHGGQPLQIQKQVGLVQCLVHQCRESIP